MKEIPIPYVRANQIGIIVLVLLGLIFQQPWPIILLWIIQVAGLSFGPKGNLFIQLAKPLLTGKIPGSRTEAAELQRFNASLAVFLLTIALLCFVVGWTTAALVFAACVAAAAFIAVCGYCVGCFLYFQLKKFRAGARR